MKNFYIRTILAGAMMVFALCSLAQDKQIGQDRSTAPTDPWVLIATYLVTPDSGGSVGASFQEFSSKQRCEAAIQVLNAQALKHENGLGKVSFVPKAQCVQR